MLGHGAEFRHLVDTHLEVIKLLDVIKHLEVIKHLGVIMPLSRFSKLSASCGVAALAALAFVSSGPAASAAQIEVVLQNDAFSPSELKAPANTPFTVKVINKDAAAEIEAKDLKIEKIVAGNSEIIVRVGATKPGRYLVVNEYKEETVKGYVVVE